MRFSLKKQSGITLLETILVATIASSIIILSYQQYLSYKLDSDIMQVKYNVDQLFQAANDYYQANCRRQTDNATQGPKSGTGALDPANNPANPTVITPLQLYQAGYLRQMLPLVPKLVYDSGQNSMDGYRIQFNLLTPQQARSVVVSDGSTKNIGTIQVWRIQVAVNMNQTSGSAGKFSLQAQNNAKYYVSQLGATCVSNIISGTTVNPCGNFGNTVGDYAVFERLPSYVTPTSNSGMYYTNPTIKQFNQQYTTYPILYMTGSTPPAGASQNYLCGT